MAEIIVYFSRRDENYVSGTIRKLDIGNTEIAAGWDAVNPIFKNFVPERR